MAEGTNEKNIHGLSFQPLPQGDPGFAMYPAPGSGPPSPLPVMTVKTKGDENEERGNWSNHMEFLLSCIGYAVGLGNVWRFPYLCYSNGGGAFLIPYLVMLLFAGLPLFFMELAFGQYSSSGPIRCWNSVPMFRGVGIGMVIVSAWVGIYYNVVITYTLYYMFMSLTTSLPWAGCDHEWNTAFCSDLYKDCIKSGGIITFNNTCVPVGNLTSVEMDMYNITVNGNSTDLSSYVDPLKGLRVRPTEEFYKNGMLHDSGDIGKSGYIIWQLALCLALAWLLVFGCLVKGIKSSGKVVYFTATFPYIVLVILLFRGITLEGYWKGVEYFVTPRWNHLGEAKVWKDAAVQIFYSLSASWGGLITLSSYNRFKNNCLRDAILVPVLNCGTSILAGFVIFSILGNMSHELDKPVENVIDETFGLAFIVYPEAVLHFPAAPVWSFLFFFMLLTLGLDSQFCIVETVVTAVMDQFPEKLKGKKTFVVAGYCGVCFLLGLNTVTQAGNYWVWLMDKYAADFALLIFGLCECIALGWCYGAKRFTNDIRTMLGDKVVDSIFFKWWPLNWCCITPCVLAFVLMFNWISWTNPTAKDYEFPPWAHAIGWLMISSTLIFIPIVWVWEFIRAEGTVTDRLRTMITPTSEWGPALQHHREEATRVHQRNGTIMGGTVDGVDAGRITKYMPCENGVSLPLEVRGACAPPPTEGAGAVTLQGYNGNAV
ncbi:sodium- and chloride-dependent neutral and basic amino acid transporter B(0+)-like [Asterias rubens]|uniref:sodium- and chloride-dependent neutral and basic amino acid transporter B(0+)-like n=1 Tax=Asterias rubens TaxID=7604 RepID=UPI0014550F8C|nr:sodium- and chloride-dependent neutral and basic amino acid transporter B(0+)-like [Asterias rubens]